MFSCQVDRKELVSAMSDIVAQRDHWNRMRSDRQAESVERFSMDWCLRQPAIVLTRAAGKTTSLAPAEVVAQRWNEWS
jgi:hypothetical protein